jgi:hypothetical protein
LSRITGERERRANVRFRPIADLGTHCDLSPVTEANAPNPLKSFVKPIIGLPAWGVHQGYGSFLTFDFGEPKLKVHDRKKDGRPWRQAYVQGQWQLWIDCCHWRVVRDSNQIAWSEDSTEVISSAAAFLNGQKLRSLSVAPAQGRSTFMFDLGGSLETWPYEDDLADEQWIILTETEAFAYRADGAYWRGPCDTPPDAQHWLPLR